MVREIKFTIEDLERFPDDGKRRELIGGQIFVSTAPSIHHQLVVKRLTTLLDNFLAEHPLGVALPGVGVIFGIHDGVIPDVVFVSAERIDLLQQQRMYAPPDWAIEVLSPSNSDYDLQTKRKLYQQQGVRLYWAINLEHQEILVFEDDEQPAVFKRGDQAAVPMLPGLSIDVGTLTRKTLP